ncbi:hypothetical protein [Pigmentiphaga humi]|nr:hypothetical protein [Pigmentiphaga humi]
MERFHGHGQAMAEALLALGVLGLLLVFGASVGRLQDIALQTAYAARHVAFAVALDAPEHERQEAAARFFSGPLHAWRNHDGSPLLAGPEPVRLVVFRQADGLPAGAEVGGTDVHASMLRTELLPGYQGLRAGRIDVAPRLSTAAAAASWPAMDLVLSSRYAILAGAGEADSDADVQARLGAAPRAWRDAAEATGRAGRGVSALGRVDAGWGRPAPQFDWLSAWAGLVPADRLGAGR